jgi:hypothetical protein
MAIDLIENDKELAFAPSRMGLKSFADEDCKNYFGAENFFGKDIEQYYNLFGSRTRKNSIENVKREQNAYWRAAPQKSCSDLKLTLAKQAIDIEKLTKLSATSNEFWIQPALETAREWEAKFKKMQADMNCLESEAKAKAEREKAETLATLEKLGDLGVQKSKQDLMDIGQPSADGEKILGLDKKVVVYGGIGVGALLIFALILRK